MAKMIKSTMKGKGKATKGAKKNSEGESMKMEAKEHKAMMKSKGKY